MCSWAATSGEVLEVDYAATDAAHLSGATGDEVSGVGDEARFDVNAALVVRAGDAYFSVQVIAIGVSSGLDAHADAVELATIVAEQLA